VRVAVRRRDGVVHAVKNDMSEWTRDVLAASKNFSTKVAWCGQRMKVYETSTNRITGLPVNCIACIAGELKHGQKETAA
jgi:hypothetical protein